MTNSNPKKILFPKTRLSELLDQPGGVDRDAAVAEAARAIESLREDCSRAINESIAEIEAVLARQKAGRLPAGSTREILSHADRIVTLAGTYGYANLDAAARALCDLIVFLETAGLNAAVPVAVHVQALRLLMPDAPELPPAEIERMLAELAKVLAHFKAAASPRKANA